MPPGENYSDELLSIAIRPEVLVAVWHHAPELASVRAADKVLVAHGRAPESLDYLGVIEDADNFPSDAARKKLAELLGEHNFRRVALLFPHGGFKASIVRSIVSAMGLMSRKAGVQKVFSQLDEAVSWLAEGRPAARADEFESLARELSKMKL